MYTYLSLCACAHILIHIDVEVSSFVYVRVCVERVIVRECWHVCMQYTLWMRWVVATHCNTYSLQHTATHCSTYTLQHALQHTATHMTCIRVSYSLCHVYVGMEVPYCNTLQNTATHGRPVERRDCTHPTLQHTAKHCNTHCNTLKYSAAH